MYETSRIFKIPLVTSIAAHKSCHKCEIKNCMCLIKRPFNSEQIKINNQAFASS